MAARDQDREIETTAPIGDEVKKTTCYMCACRCGINVHLKDGEVRFIEGNRDHPVNKGVLCAKGSAGIMHLKAPGKLTKPLKRVGPRGSGQFEAIEWDEALAIATDWLGRIRSDDPSKLAFFTGRDQSQALTSWWAQRYGTPNYAAHGGFCSVNMAAAGLYTIGSAFWEFSEPDWELTRYLMLFGVAEDHDSNPIKTGLGKLKTRGAKVVSINPIQTGYSAIADEWLGITPGSDGLFVLALVHELLRAGQVDAPYLRRYTNAGWLVIDDPGGAEDGLFARDADGAVLCWDTRTQAAAPAMDKDAAPALKGEYQLPDEIAGGKRARPVFHLLAERYLDDQYSPDAVATATGIAAEAIRRIAAEIAHTAFAEEVVVEQPWTDWTGQRHERMIGRPVAMHAMRGISAHSNGFHTCRAIHVLQLLLGSIDAPGGMRYKPPYPKSLASLPRPTGRPEDVAPEAPLPGPHLGFLKGPEDLLLGEDGRAFRIDKAFSWGAPLAVHGMMHMVIANAHAGDPYPIDTLFFYMANMAWNSSMNTPETIRMLTDKDEATGEYKIPRIIYSDAFASETVAYADLVLPDTTYLERWDCISLLDRPISDADGAADAIRQPVVTPDRDVRPFQDVLLDLGARLGLPGMAKEDGTPVYPGGYSDYITNHERRPGIGMLAGWRGEKGEKTGKGEPNPDQLARYVENGCFWRGELAPEMRYFRNVNRAYLGFAVEMEFIHDDAPIIAQLYAEELQRFRLAARGHGSVTPPEEHRERVETYFDPLPFWYPPLEDQVTEDKAEKDDYPLHAVTQRPMAMYHSWGSPNAWLRQIHGANRLYVPRAAAQAKGIEDDDWVWLTSRTGRIKVQVRLMDAVNPHTVWTWNAVGKRAGAWGLGPDVGETKQGFLLNHLIDECLPQQPGGMRYSNSDPVTGQAAWYDLRVRMEKVVAGEDVGETAPQFEPLAPPPGLAERPRILRTGARKAPAS
ncbi:MAG TPA: molybdopterin oxidoreductase family protein [Alphaproteobacteria bacterium]|nr:molybdopterin oxidoreductase family protein [Alphaproteobacteria bacterium]